MKYCEACIYAALDGCEIASRVGMNETDAREVVRVCKAAGWRVRRAAYSPGMRHSKATGQWAEYLAKK